MLEGWNLEAVDQTDAARAGNPHQLLPERSEIGFVQAPLIDAARAA